MTKLIELTPQQHQSLFVVPYCGTTHAANKHLLNIRVTEVAKASCCMPVMFVRDNQTGHPVLTALTSFEAGSNLLVANHQWQGLYTPTSMQTHPFYLMQSPDAPQQYTIGINPDDDSAFSTKSGQTIFETDGSASLFLSQIKTLIETDLNNDRLTHKFTEKLTELGLIKSIDIAVNYAQGLAQNLTGLSTINEEKLQQLDKDTLAELNQLGYLSPIYAMLASLYQLNHLIKLNNLRHASNDKTINNITLEVSKR